MTGVVFSSADELLDFYANNGSVWLSVVGADAWPYLVTSNEYGDVFVQGIPNEPDEPSFEWLEGKNPYWYPVTLVATG